MSLVADIELKSSADKFLKAITSQMNSIPTASSDKIHGVQVHEGDWEAHGSVKFWTYTIDGDVENCKEMIEIDEKNKIVYITYLEGHVLHHYKTYKLTFVLLPRGKGGLLKLKLQYDEIINTNFRHPQVYLDWSVSVLKDFDDHIFKDNAVDI